eukprot:tig00020537_g10294.t1
MTSKRTSPLLFFSLCSPLAATSLCFAVQSGYATKTFQELGLPEIWVSWAWLAGPLSGIIVQPIIGVWSDRCTSPLGRRRPFLLAGVLVLLLSMVFFSNADAIGARLGDRGGCKEGGCSSALAIAVVSFWVQDFALNALQGPARTLLVDLLPQEEQNRGNAGIAFTTGLGTVVGNLVGSLELRRLAPALGTDLRALYLFSILWVILSVAPVLLFVRERPYVERRAAHERPGVLQMLRRALVLPRHVAHTFAVQCCTWFAWFVLAMYGANWVGRNVYPGDPHGVPGERGRDLYDAGVRYGNLGLALLAAVSMAFSLVLPALLARLGTRRVYLAAHLLHSASLLSTLWVARWASEAGGGGDPPAGSVAAAVALFATLGVPWASTMTIPWSAPPAPARARRAITGVALHDERSRRGLRRPPPLAAAVNRERSDADPDGLSPRRAYGTEASGAGGGAGDGGWDAESSRSVEEEDEAEHESAGLVMAIMNLSQCLPEIVASFVGYGLLSAMPGNNSAILCSAGISTLLGALLIAFMRIPSELDSTSDY